MKFNKIGRNENISFGQPIVLGTRLTVFDVVFGVLNDGVIEYSHDHKLGIEDINEAVNYCKELACQNSLHGKFCNGCILQTLKTGVTYSKEELNETLFNKEKYVISADGNNLYLGDFSEYEEDQFGRLGWAIAEQVLTNNNTILKSDI